MESIYRIYISGPMSGIPDFNKPAFFKAEEILREHKHIVINPATSPDGLGYGHYMDIAMAMVRSSQVVAVLPGWQNSPGALAEIAYAKSLKKKIVYFCVDLHIPHMV